MIINFNGIHNSNCQTIKKQHSTSIFKGLKLKQPLKQDTIFFSASNSPKAPEDKQTAIRIIDLAKPDEQKTAITGFENAFKATNSHSQRIELANCFIQNAHESPENALILINLVLDSKIDIETKKHIILDLARQSEEPAVLQAIEDVFTDCNDYNFVGELFSILYTKEV
ncbi:MAG: hypothetical protein AB1782_00715 [Cyanobacteriota bacterium]